MIAGALFDSGRVIPSTYQITDAFLAPCQLELDAIDDARVTAERACRRAEQRGALTLLPLSLAQAVLSGGFVLLAVLAERFFGFQLGRRQWVGIVLVAVSLALLGLTGTGTIAAWLPLFLFVILFGLSMDYHVFILSRVREAVNRGMSNDDAVAHGIKSTAGVVTSAALVMVAVFGSFSLASDQLAKQIGVGLAVAILIDATIIRGVLLPAGMKLLGASNWYLPKRLSWLPKLEHEAEAAPAAV